MFRLVVLLFVVNNGVVAESPAGIFKNKHTFETEKSCMEFLTTEPGKRSRLSIEELIEKEKGKLQAKFACVQDGAIKGDDGSI